VRATADGDDVDDLFSLPVEDSLSWPMPFVGRLSISEDENEGLPISLFPSPDRRLDVLVERLLENGERLAQGGAG
jgi:hypothetical protein